MELDTDTLLARYAAEHYEPNSISAERRKQSTALLLLLAERLNGRSLIELTPSDLMAWQGEELKRGMKPTTVGKRQNMIRAFVNWAYTAGLLPFELTVQLKSVSGVRGSRVKSMPKPYQRSEIQTFRELLAEKYPLIPARGRGSRALSQYLSGRGQFNVYLKRHARRLMFEAQVSLAVEEGLRSIEIYSTRIADMHPENESVLVRTAKKAPGDVRLREVPFTDHSRQCIADWLELREQLTVGHDFPWLSLSTREVPRPESFWQHIKALEVIEGDWEWHRFRHTFATERLRAGMPLEQLQIMLGHARLEQTLAYAQIVNADVRAEATRTNDAFARNLGLDTTP